MDENKERTMYCTIKVTGRAPMKIFKTPTVNGYLYEIEFVTKDNKTIKAGGLDAVSCLKYISDYTWER